MSRREKPRILAGRDAQAQARAGRARERDRLKARWPRAKGALAEQQPRPALLAPRQALAGRSRAARGADRQARGGTRAPEQALRHAARGEPQARAVSCSTSCSVVSDISSDLDPSPCWRGSPGPSGDPGLRHRADPACASPAPTCCAPRLRRARGRGTRAPAQAGTSASSDFQSWLKDEFRSSRSYLHQPQGGVQPHDCRADHTADLGTARRTGSGTSDDVLLVPLYNRAGRADRLLLGGRPGRPHGAAARDHRDARDVRQPRGGGDRERAALPPARGAPARGWRTAEPAHEGSARAQSNFVATVSHELRTPLTAIRAYVDAMLGARRELRPRAESRGSSRSSTRRPAAGPPHRVGPRPEPFRFRTPAPAPPVG